MQDSSKFKIPPVPESFVKYVDGLRKGGELWLNEPVQQRGIILFILAAAILPFLWGWSVHWLISKLWPENRYRARSPKPTNVRSSPPLDYQI
jgi:hypothetical protein